MATATEHTLVIDATPKAPIFVIRVAVVDSIVFATSAITICIIGGVIVFCFVFAGNFVLIIGDIVADTSDEFLGIIDSIVDRNIAINAVANE